MIVRQLAEWDATRTAAIMAWPLRELLLAYLDLLKRQAQHQYEVDLQMWAALAPHQKDPSKPPQPPRILRS